MAVIKGDVPFTENLLKSGANTNSLADSKLSPLYFAVKYDHIQISQLLLKFKADVNQANSIENRPIHIAIIHENMDMLKLLLDNNAENNCLNKDAMSPLALAAYKNNIEIAKLLLRAGAIVDIDNTPLLNKPLNISKRKGFTELEKLLNKYHSQEK